MSRLVNMTLKKQIESDKLATFNIPNLKEIIKESKINFNIQTIKWGDDGSEKQSSSVVASITGVIFTMLIYMFILIYGGMVMQGVMEEKTNRIIEIMISSVKPFDLMMGKIIGIGFVGAYASIPLGGYDLYSHHRGNFLFGRRYGKRDLAIKHGT